MTLETRLIILFHNRRFVNGVFEEKTGKYRPAATLFPARGILGKQTRGEMRQALREQGKSSIILCAFYNYK